MVCCMADLPVGTMYWCFFLDACLVVVVAGSDDVLRAGFFLPVTLRELASTICGSPLRCTVWWTRESVRSHRREWVVWHRLGQEA